MGSKSKRRHAQKQYNRAQNKVPAPVADEVDATLTAEDTADETAATETAPASLIMTPKELRKAEKERQKNEKRLAKEQAKANPQKDKKDKKDKGEKKPFFLIRFFKWIGRTFAEIGSELKKVHWPTFKQICKATGIVLGIVFAFGVLLLGIWGLLSWLHSLLV